MLEDFCSLSSLDSSFMHCTELVWSQQCSKWDKQAQQMMITDLMTILGVFSNQLPLHHQDFIQPSLKELLEELLVDPGQHRLELVDFGQEPLLEEFWATCSDAPIVVVIIRDIGKEIIPAMPIGADLRHHRLITVRVLATPVLEREQLRVLEARSGDKI